jgi:hypothetical protein
LPTSPLRHGRPLCSNITGIKQLSEWRLWDSFILAWISGSCVPFYGHLWQWTDFIDWYIPKNIWKHDKILTVVTFCARAHTHTHTHKHVCDNMLWYTSHPCYNLWIYTSVVKCSWVSNAASKFWNILSNLYITARRRTTNKFKFRYTSVKEMT